MTVADALNKAEHSIKSASLSPRLDAEVLLAHVLERPRGWLITQVNARLLPWPGLCFWWLVRERQRGLPVAYLTHTKEFYGRQFYLNHHVLIPRPETEILIEEAIRLIRHRWSGASANQVITTIIDVGTGSGCIAITLALELPQIQIIATDLSRSSLQVARINARRYKVNNRLVFFQGDLIQPLVAASGSLLPNSLLLANLPYLTTAELQGELTHEPRTALDGGGDGLRLYRRLLDQLTALPTTARPRWLMLELHPPTWPRLNEMLRRAFPTVQITALSDLNQQPRLAVVEFWH